MKTFYDRVRKRLVFIGESANSRYWDRHWQQTPKTILKSASSWLLDTVRKHVSPNSLILEGGCGHGSQVKVLNEHGYRTIGLDFAFATLKSALCEENELRLVCGNVEKLPFRCNHFDAYCSLGVIEHFFGGYADILWEVVRVLKPGGILILTVPTLSKLKQIKAALGCYKEFQPSHNRDFYQYAFCCSEIITCFEKFGFRLISQRNISGFKGFKDDFTCLGTMLGSIYQANSLLTRIIRRGLDICLTPFANHATLFVFQVVK